MNQMMAGILQRKGQPRLSNRERPHVMGATGCVALGLHSQLNLDI